MKKSLTLGFVPAILAGLLSISFCADKSFAEGNFDLSTVGNVEGVVSSSVSSSISSSVSSSVAASAAATAANSASRQAMCEIRKMLRTPGYAAWHSNEGQTYMTQGSAAGPGNLLTLP